MLTTGDQENLLAVMMTGMNIPVREIVAKINHSLKSFI